MHICCSCRSPWRGCIWKILPDFWPWTRAAADPVHSLFSWTKAHHMKASKALVVLKSGVHFHAGNDCNRHIGCKILVVIISVVRKGKKVISVLIMTADYLFRAACPVRSSGVAVEPALQHFSFSLECLLLYHDCLPPQWFIRQILIPHRPCSHAIWLPEERQLRFFCFCYWRIPFPGVIKW